MMGKAQQAVIKGQHVVRIPIGTNAALYFTKTNTLLKVYAYKWLNQKPTEKPFTGMIDVYSFQTSALNRLVYTSGILNKSINKLSLNAPSNGKIVTDITITIFDQIWCWLTGGTWAMDFNQPQGDGTFAMKCWGGSQSSSVSDGDGGDSGGSGAGDGGSGDGTGDGTGDSGSSSSSPGLGWGTGGGGSVGDPGTGTGSTPPDTGGGAGWVSPSDPCSTSTSTDFPSTDGSDPGSRASVALPCDDGSDTGYGPYPLVPDNSEIIYTPSNADWSTEPDNEVLVDPDPNPPVEYQQSTPWPTISPVIPYTLFVPMRNDANNRNVNCLTLAKEQIGKVGYTVSGYLPGTQTFQTYTQSNGVNSSQTKQAITYIIATLSINIPVIAGVDAYAGSTNLDGITDHFITIDAMGTDANGKYFHFIDNSTSSLWRGTSPNNKLYYNDSTVKISGSTDSTYPANVTGGSNVYTVTQIRKSIKK